MKATFELELTPDPVEEGARRTFSGKGEVHVHEREERSKATGTFALVPEDELPDTLSDGAHALAFLLAGHLLGGESLGECHERAMDAMRHAQLHGLQQVIDKGREIQDYREAAFAAIQAGLAEAGHPELAVHVEPRVGRALADKAKAHVR